MGRRLVRDRALENWVVPGAEHQVRPVHDVDEHRELLTLKLLEEMGEVITSRTRSETLKELADLFAVMQAYASISGIEWGEVMDAVIHRRLESGGFTRGMVWETSR